MSTVPLTELGNLLQDLLGNWKKEFPKRAAGGWWALSGFALQTSVYLLRFFQQLEKGVEPGLLAEMEHLSDIWCPSDGKLTLIQVKRTLTRHALISAVEEAYLITDLCRQKTPALINHLRFQIACSKRLTATKVADLSFSEVITSGGDIASWDLMIRCFDEVAPITEEPDALDQLYMLLWNAGIRNTHALIERCVGRLLMSFGTSDPTTLRQVGRELADYFFSAERHEKWEPVGILLTAEETVPDSKASEYSGVLTGQQPRLEHLMMGFFRDRPHIFNDLWETFKGWVSSLDSPDGELDDKVPVFWVSGRSGEGKSVLLIQLVAEALRSGIVSPLLQLKEGDDLPRLLTTAPDRYQLSDRSFGRIFAVVDDVYDLHRHERDEWDAIILNECDYRPPPVAIICCGPTEQKEQFTARLSGSFEVTSFELPMLSTEECRAFLSWYESRTGEAREWSELTTENPLLVQLIFELAHGESMPEFARRFRKRLSDIKVFNEARALLAVNALYMDAPLSLLVTDESRDALEYLCKDEQLHFRMSSGSAEKLARGVRLAHPHLAWLLFIEWIERSPTTRSKAWARELAKSLSIFEDAQDALMAGNLLTRLLQTTRLSDGDGPDSLQGTANRRELIRELYRLNIANHGGLLAPATLARWLELEYELSGLRLVPDPAHRAVAIFDEATLAPFVRGVAIFWLCRIAESRPEHESREIYNAAREFCLRYSDNPGVGHAVSSLFAKKRDDPLMIRFTIDWLTNNLLNPQAFGVLALLVAARPNDEEVVERTFDWLAANENHPESSWPLAMLVGNSVVSGISERAADWLAINEVRPQAHHLISRLIYMDPNDAQARERAFNWLVAHEQHPDVHLLLPTLIAANPGNTEVQKLALDWLTTNERHSKSPQVIAPLVAANPNDPEVIDCVTRWLSAHERYSMVAYVLAPLLAANPTDAEVVKFAVTWLRANETHARYHELLKVMIARSGGSKEWLDRGVEYLKKPNVHPEAILGVLLTGSKADPKFIEMAFQFIEGTTSTSQRKAVLYQMSRALTYYFHNAVQYLHGPYDEQRKRTVCASIALGMKRFPDTIASFALEVVAQLDPDHGYHILWNVITRHLENDYLDEMIAQWLVDNYRRRGYGGMLKALRNNPDFWQRLLILEELPKKIVGDFDAQTS